ncbi:MAG: L-serine ammonia-lyase, iron-sulfur-dependent, subunit alpha [Synergistaceae bacterium]|nr:L-serine ammonia-lyase, iron-sulfur-dependent, subunit alpha [Synergistaceae bacterium]
MLKAVEKIVRLADDRKIAFPEAVLILDAAETGVPAEEIRARMAERLADMRRSVREACGNTAPCRIEPQMGPKLRSYQGAMSGDFILAASATAMEVASYNATMGRIVAAPTAGSCGIIPGMLFAWEFFCGEGMDTEALLVDALITAGAVGEVTAFRATLAGADGGCQAECGAAAAMGSAALAFLQGGTPAMSAHAAAMTFKSVLGLACDPVGGLVECPCIKRNGILVANGTLCADMALAGIESVIPLDEVIDSMGQIGRMMAPALRETSQGGLAVTPTAAELMKAGQERIGC